MSIENVDKTIDELTQITEISESDTIPIWDESSNKTKKAPIGMIEDKITPIDDSAPETSTSKTWSIKKIVEKIIGLISDNSSESTTDKTWSIKKIVEKINDSISNLVPTTRKINDKTLDYDISLNYSDIGALSSSIDELYYSTTGIGANSSATLSNDITNYKFLIVVGDMYGLGEQCVTSMVPVRLLIGRIGFPTGVTRFILNGSISGNTRRIYFGFENARTIYTGAIEGTSGHLPRLYAVYGIK